MFEMWEGLLLREIIQIKGNEYVKEISGKENPSTCKSNEHKFEESFKQEIFDAQQECLILTAFNETCVGCGMEIMYYMVNSYEKAQILIENFLEEKCVEALENKKEVYFELHKDSSDDNLRCRKFGHDFESSYEGLDKEHVDGLIRKFNKKITFEYGFCKRCDHRYGRIFPINLKNFKR